jgi:hypothetical protein
MGRPDSFTDFVTEQGRGLLRTAWLLTGDAAVHTNTPEPPQSIDLVGMAARIQSRDRSLRRRWVLPAIAAAAVVAVVAAGLTVARLTDGSGSGTPVAGDQPSVAAKAAKPSPEALAWANKLVERWDSGTTPGNFVPIGDWEFQEAGRWTDVMGADRPYSLALATRLIVSRTELPTESSIGSVRWDDGLSQASTMLSAKASYDGLLTGGVRCGNCPAGTFDGVELKPLTVTTAAPATMRVRTDRGSATIPAWRFSFAETKVQALQAAVRGPSMAPTPASMGASAPLSIAIDQVTVAPDDRTLTASFGGAPAGGPCGADYSAYAVQGARAVGIVVVPVPTKRTGNYACTAQAVGRTITVHLDQPLNDRVVIETVHGAAVQVSH